MHRYRITYLYSYFTSHYTKVLSYLTNKPIRINKYLTIFIIVRIKYRPTFCLQSIKATIGFFCFVYSLSLLEKFNANTFRVKNSQGNHHLVVPSKADAQVEGSAKQRVVP